MFSNFSVNLLHDSLSSFYGQKERETVHTLSKQHNKKILTKNEETGSKRTINYFDKETNSLKNLDIKILIEEKKIIISPVNKDETEWVSVTGNRNNFIDQFPFFLVGGIEITYKNGLTVKGNDGLHTCGDLSFNALSGHFRIVSDTQNNSIVRDINISDQVVITTLFKGRPIGKYTINNPKNNQDLLYVAGNLTDMHLTPSRVCTNNRNIYEGTFPSTILQTGFNETFERPHLKNGKVTFYNRSHRDPKDVMKLSGDFNKLGSLTQGYVWMPFNHGTYQITQEKDKKYATGVTPKNATTWQLNFSPCYNNGYLKNIQIEHKRTHVIITRIIDQELKDSPIKSHTQPDVLSFAKPKQLHKFLSANPLDQSGWSR